ncbi:hypothetical protein [Amnibacterium kyonggiense]|uniref:hypothetical protein n=1 Tax=Amnibacterium kyonggiense TaxID=595671 RepID=UPI00105DDCFE|nr:hypothetical protein [Amnibacterium kyonggiense]
MLPDLRPVADPWRIELVVVRGSHTSGERRAISRDVERGLLLRLRPGAYVERTAFEVLTPEDRHLVRMRAVAAVAPGTVLFSHASAALLHGLPVLRQRLGSVHVTVEDEDDRHRTGLTMHRFLVQDREVVRFSDLVTTGVGRTVVDLAGGLPFEEGVMAASGALAAGVPRVLLEEAIGVAGPRRANRRMRDAIAFGHPGAESAGESRTLVTFHRLGLEVPQLQHRLQLSDGSSAFVDAVFPRVLVGAEFDGEQKFLDPSMAPDGAGRAVLREKRREDEVRARLNGLVRFGWAEAGSPPLLRARLAQAGVVAPRRRVPFDEWVAAARAASPRRPPSTPRWRA